MKPIILPPLPHATADQPTIEHRAALADPMRAAVVAALAIVTAAASASSKYDVAAELTKIQSILDEDAAAPTGTLMDQFERLEPLASAYDSAKAAAYILSGGGTAEQKAELARLEASKATLTAQVETVKAGIAGLKEETAAVAAQVTDLKINIGKVNAKKATFMNSKDGRALTAHRAKMAELGSQLALAKEKAASSKRTFDRLVGFAISKGIGGRDPDEVLAFMGRVAAVEEREGLAPGSVSAHHPSLMEAIS